MQKREWNRNRSDDGDSILALLFTVVVEKAQGKETSVSQFPATNRQASFVLNRMSSRTGSHCGPSAGPSIHR
jgi:hypothetical protein